MRRASKRNSLMLIKADMGKAYDKVSWRYLEAVLKYYGFHVHFIKQILCCIQSPTFSVIINGAPSGWFSSFMDLRQGCPLFPFLFVLCSDMLSRSLNELFHKGSLHGYQPRQHDLSFTNLMFVDDLVLMVKASINNARLPMKIIESYCTQFRQQINVQKSQIRFSSKIDMRVKQQILEICSVPLKQGVWNYLGVPLSG